MMFQAQILLTRDGKYQDGLNFTADMSVHNFVGDAMRGPRVSLHNGGGVGWGEVINGGFGLALDGRKMLILD